MKYSYEVFNIYDPNRTVVKEFHGFYDFKYHSMSAETSIVDYMTYRHQAWHPNIEHVSYILLVNLGIIVYFILPYLQSVAIHLQPAWCSMKSTPFCSGLMASRTITTPVLLRFIMQSRN